MILPILSVKDVDASISFYTEVLGFAHAFSMEGPDGKNTFAMVTHDVNTIGLSLNPADALGAKGVDFMLYIPETMDLDTYYADVQAKHAPIKEEIGDRYWGDRTFTVTDPDGYALVFAKTVSQIAMEDIQDHLKNPQPE